jgi:hypothetical protein
MNKNVIKIDLIENITIHMVELIIISKKPFVICFMINGCPPPKKKITNKLDIKSIFAYSPKKNAANIIAEYSTLYPATNSASASGKSKGARFVSAKIEIKKIIEMGSKGKKNQIVSFCVIIIIFRLSELLNKITGKIIKLIETSYEIICETERKDPMSAYLELLDQPDNKIP